MKILRYILLAFLTAFVLVARNCVAVGEWYATTVYPVVSATLSWSVSWIPFSMEEVLVVVAAQRKQNSFRYKKLPPGDRSDYGNG